VKFRDDNSGRDKLVVVQVKSGSVSVGMVRDLKGTMDREKATIGVFITLETPTRGMLKEAAAAGFYEPEHFRGRRYPRVQVLTIEEILQGRKVQYPEAALTTTFKRAGWREKGRRYEQSSAIEVV
jgi:site-specific DNA-methyltransferase (adenine-specific)